MAECIWDLHFGSVLGPLHAGNLHAWDLHLGHGYFHAWDLHAYGPLEEGADMSIGQADMGPAQLQLGSWVVIQDRSRCVLSECMWIGLKNSDEILHVTYYIYTIELIYIYIYIYIYYILHVIYYLYYA